MKTVTVAYNSVKRDLRRESEYIGLKGGAYDRVRALESDDEQLCSLFKTGVNEAGALLLNLLARPVSVDDATREATFALRTTNNGFDLLEGALSCFIASHALLRWLVVTAQPIVDAYMARHQQLREELVKLSYRREMPR